MRALRVVGNYLQYVVSYLLAIGSLVAAATLLAFLHDTMAETRVSYPSLPPISGTSLTKPTFLRSVPLQTPKAFNRAALSVSPDGSQITYWGRSEESRGRGLFVADVDKDADTVEWHFVASHSWSPDSTRLLLQARQDELGANGIAIANVDDRGDLRIDPPVDWLILPPDIATANPPIPITAVDWFTDGKAILFVQPKPSDPASELWRLDLASGQKQRLSVLPKEPDKPNTTVRNLSVSPDGKKVSFVNADRLGAERSSTWWIMNIDGSSALPLMRRAQETGFVQSWDWSPDGRQVVYDVKMPGDGRYQPTTLWAMNSDGTARKQIGISENLDGYAISPAGNWAIYGADSHLWMANIETGREEQVTFGDDNESRPMWLANGDVLYHHTVGSATSLRLLVRAEPADLPGIAPAARP